MTDQDLFDRIAAVMSDGDCYRDGIDELARRADRCRPLLRSALRSGEMATEVSAIYVLEQANLFDEECVEAAVDLQDAPGSGADACRYARRLGTWRLPVMIEELGRTPPDAATTRRAAKLVAAFDEALEVVERSMRSPSAATRVGCARVLSAARTGKAWKLLDSMAQDPDPEVRAAAVHASEETTK